MFLIWLNPFLRSIVSKSGFRSFPLIFQLLYFVWSPPWHLYILLLANLLAFYLTYPLAFYLAYLLAYVLAYLLAFYLANFLAFYLAYLLAFYLANLLAFYLAFYVANLLAYILTYLLAFYLTYLLAYILTYPTWGPAGNTWPGYSRLRSGREHWAWMVVVEVRQGTLGGDGRCWGPAGNTGRGWSWLRSDREHCGSRVAVEQEDEEDNERRRRGEEEEEEDQATDIKSNNPHLAGGEKTRFHIWLNTFLKSIQNIGQKLDFEAFP